MTKIKNWTIKEDLILINKYPHNSKALLVKLLPSRTWGAIKARAQRLGVQKDRWWTEKEDAVLINNYERTSKKLLMKQLPNRTWTAILQHANELEQNRVCHWWSEKEDAKFKKLIVQGYSLRDISKITGKSVSALAHRNSRKLRYNINVRRRYKPNLNPSPALFYTLGVLKGDGSVPNCTGRNFYLGLEAKDEVFVQSFCNSVHDLQLHNAKTKIFFNKKTQRVYYYCRVGSKNFVEWYRKISLRDIEKMIGNKKDLIISFLRGFYESEGHSEHRENKGIDITISNTDEYLSSFISKLIKKLGFSSSIHAYNISVRPRNKDVLYIIRILGNSIQKIRFLKMLSPSIKGIEALIKKSKEMPYTCRKKLFSILKLEEDIKNMVRKYAEIKS